MGLEAQVSELASHRQGATHGLESGVQEICMHGSEGGERGSKVLLHGPSAADGDRQTFFSSML